jgi:ATP-dependent DNA helicase RecG
MFVGELCEKVSVLDKVGKETASALAQAGISSIASLLGYYPRRWEDRSKERPLKDFRLGTVNTLAKVIAHDWFLAKGIQTLRVFVDDGTACAALVCFNRPKMRFVLPVGRRFRLFGDFEYRLGNIQAASFTIEDENAPGGIFPVYPLVKALSELKGGGQKALRAFMRQALKKYAAEIEDELPAEIIAAHSLLHKRDAIRAIHFPSSFEELEKAVRTLKYGELFYFEVMIARRAIGKKKFPTKDTKETKLTKISPLQNQLLARLPFELTAGQERAVAEINDDLRSPSPMSRLLQGDVGSGKTLVAFLAALAVVEEGGQAAVMAPTELLARQHAENAAKLLEPLGVKLGFLTGNVKSQNRARLLESIAAGETDIILGTHALFSKDVAYKNLRLVIIDEQHRFGVLQRQAIAAKGDAPAMLMMSATPIPRSLALTVYGDLDVTVIRDMPPGRQPVKTYLIAEENAAKVYGFVRKELEAGRQAYFVYPLIGDNGGDSNEEEKNDDNELKNAVAMADELKKIFPACRTALIHSRLDEEEKQKTMEAFRAGEVKILAATSVVEVGVDVPNATVMAVWHAERFGLSALHQLRGRVGRGEHQSYCCLIYSKQEEAREDINPESIPDEQRTKEGRRLMAMLETNDGFVIAEKDLELRGAGQLAGIEQSGDFRLGLADPVRDIALLSHARDDVFALLAADPALASPDNAVVAEVLKRAPPFEYAGA